METPDFLTEKFFESSLTVFHLVNKLVDNKHVADREMYQSGEVLFIEVYETDETKSILSEVISDLQAYKEYNAKCFISADEPETPTIVLMALLDLHEKQFGLEEALIWNGITERFIQVKDYEGSMY